jgi:hypothetical protein
MKRSASLKLLNRSLDRFARMLDDCAGQIRDLNPKRNIRKIGEALWNIFEIQFADLQEAP